MNVTAHQEKKKNEDLSFCGCLGGSMAKNGFREVPGVTGTLRKANSHFDPTQTG